MQTEKQAVNKSKSLHYLLEHTLTYSLIWYIPVSLCLIDYNLAQSSEYLFGYKMLLFPLITFFFHTLTDYFTSKLNSKLWEKKDSHNFFVSVGFDQLLHFIQLLLTYHCLS